MQLARTGEYANHACEEQRKNRRISPYSIGFPRTGCHPSLRSEGMDAQSLKRGLVTSFKSCRFEKKQSEGIHMSKIAYVGIDVDDKAYHDLPTV